VLFLQTYERGNGCRERDHKQHQKPLRGKEQKPDRYTGKHYHKQRAHSPSALPPSFFASSAAIVYSEKHTASKHRSSLLQDMPHKLIIYRIVGKNFKNFLNLLLNESLWNDKIL
jgi:hypothetical protein